MSNEEFVALHGRAQESLNRYVTTNRAWRRIEQRQRLLLHMLNNDSEFLLSSKIRKKTKLLFIFCFHRFLHLFYTSIVVAPFIFIH